MRGLTHSTREGELEAIIHVVTLTSVVSVYTWNEYRVAACCSVLQCVAVCYPYQCSISIHLERVPCCSVLQCVAVCCSVLQCATLTNVVSVHTWNEYRVAVCCSVLQCVAECCSVLPLTMWYQYTHGMSIKTHCIRRCRCSVLQCVAVCCGVLRCVAVCYSVSIAFVVVNISPITISCQRRRGGLERSV